MEKIIAVTFDIADQKCKMYNALEWHNFIADTREYLADGGEPADLTLEELFAYELKYNFQSTQVCCILIFNLESKIVKKINTY